MSTATRKKPQTDKGQLSIDADRLIIATNRGPVEYFKTKEGQIKSRHGSGGVVTALTSTVSKVNSTWVALAMSDADREALKSAQDGIMPSPIKDIDVRLRYVTVPKTMYRKHYDMVSNRVLWFTQHYLLEQATDIIPFKQLQDIWNNGYYKVNKAIADAVNAEIASQDSKALVMLHDYHLYLVSGMIREQHPSVAMQQFIHIPWPEHRYWASSLPTEITSDIFRGLLGNDILGFQTRGDAHNFLDGVRAFVEDAEVSFDERHVTLNGHQTYVRDYPISISVSDELRLVKSNAGKRAAEKIKPLLNKYNLMRVDRIEPTKNIVQGFLAYETLLEQHPELHGQTAFLAFLIPSRQSLPLYREYYEETMKVIEQINQKYGNEDWEPIHTFVQNDRTTALAALQFYDVLLVNSLIDGMNLVAKEGAAVNRNDGVLVLSRSSGAFQQLENASIPISPAGRNETAEALYKALTLPKEERHELSERARHEVETNDLRTWMTQQINDINELLKTRD
ncbi:alpha,alpha-trehalose-phosphate synthase (UDP-forming) [Dictyobacter aurantiacus]|uniref:Trehalose-6-phosphate synthase n=1 Tax=Dictyobacter aurantiacus TaxID=1936993 RepID=A0A401ZP11_9CHLR|nr:trehalose-6-phosphate synthase [Dictyobacter aurantiacus]GCE08486.1 trehalose-6-phosphate synthase [Dictyobacter aurantiacus]